MTNEEHETFILWLDQRLADKGWTDNQLAKKAGISHSNISKVRSTGIPPGWDVCFAIAEALNVSPITAFRKAGLLKDHKPEDEVTFEDWKDIIVKMSPEDEQEMRETALLRIERRKKEEAPVSKGSLKPRTSERIKRQGA